MKLLKNIVLTSALILPTTLLANANNNQDLQQLADNYLSSHAISEGITEVSLGVSTGSGNFQSYYAGRTSKDTFAPSPTDNNLTEVGSITKSFTGVLILQLEAQGKLNINDPISKYLSNLPAPWQKATIKELLNMTSGIPDYQEPSAFGDAYIPNYNPGPHWTPEQLIDITWKYQQKNCPSNNCVNEGIFPPGSNWSYSNTNYLLAGMIIRKITGQSLESELQHQVFARDKLNLSNTFYLPYSFSNLPVVYRYANIPNRVIHGYDFGDSYMPTGADVTNVDESEAGPGGAITSNLQDMTQWFEAIFNQNSTLQLKAQQYQELETAVCESTSYNCTPGQPVSMSPTVTDGYSLGLTTAYFPKLGIIWDYEGETFGYRFFWVLVQNPKLPIPYLLITTATNSDPSDDAVSIAYLAIQAAEKLEGIPTSNAQGSSIRSFTKSSQ